MKTAARAISALTLAFAVGVTLASANGQDIVTALRSSLVFASITAALGLVILTLLPARIAVKTFAMSGRR